MQCVKFEFDISVQDQLLRILQFQVHIYFRHEAPKISENVSEFNISVYYNSILKCLGLQNKSILKKKKKKVHAQITKWEG